MEVRMLPLRRAFTILAAIAALLAVSPLPASAQDPGGFDDNAEWPGGDNPEEELLPPDPEQIPEPVLPPPIVKPTVGGTKALLRTNGKAAIPRGAPNDVRAIIAAANKIVGKPYKWGGGHAKLVDRGYDCSGAVSFALIKSGHLASPLVSGTFARWGDKGRGRWVTIYANRKHVYMEVAGLRLDTSAVGDPGGRSGPRWRPVIGKRKGFQVRHLARPA
jgi:hypothetical protein